MTERTRKPRRPGPMPVVAGSVAAFMALFGFMAYQLRTGHDPALGAQAAQPAPVRRVVVKRVERRIVITTLVPPAGEDDAPQAAASVPTIVVQRAPAAPAPTPAPAAAPLVTRASGV